MNIYNTFLEKREKYVDNYKNKLETLGASIIGMGLITKEELETLGCTTNCLSAPNFTYSTSYWLKNAQDTNNVWYIFSDGRFSNYLYYDDGDFGIRPVVIIASNEI